MGRDLTSLQFIVGPETSTLPTEGTIESVKSATKSSNYTVLDDDELGTIIVDTGGVGITLPTAADNADRRIMIIHDASSGVVTVTPEGSENLNGLNAGINLNNRYDKIWVTCDGSEWFATSAMPTQVLQDYTTIGSVGSTDQQYAGFIPDSDILGAGTDIAYYKFASGALTTDEEGTYTLTNNNSATNTTGIMNTNFATELDGTNQYYSQSTLMDDMSIFTNGLGIDFWFKADDGQPGALQYLMRKNQGAPGTLAIQLETSGYINVFLSVSGSSTNFESSIQLENGANPWHHLAFNHDTTNGARLFIDGTLSGSAPQFNTLFGNGTAGDFVIGAVETPAQYFDGKIAQFRVTNKAFTQKDVDLLYSTKYTWPQFLTNDDFSLRAFVQEEGSTDYVSQVNFPEVHRDGTNVYRYGGVLRTTDKLRIIGGGQ